ncbi:diacylglycerol kinase [Aureimonas altamirensis]|uniref:diacylglycerol kinase n=1 Tax=Aureimonas altamirensis TaxID=370622 RepID=UPI002037448A|nr:diacylglycerol kinase [Aureimonas altamirensis]MCM2505228.1 diacylglycerol kinase [Aureimonas altamirensis]
MSTETGFRSAPAKQAGLRHLASALCYSMGGLRRLMSETAFRHELLCAAALLGLLAWTGAGAGALLGQFVLLCCLFAFEAVNTAIELLVDRVSPEFSVFAQQAKDLGSFAVLAIISGNIVWAGVALWGVVAG